MRSLEEQDAWDEAVALKARELEESAADVREAHDQARLMAAAAAVVRRRTAEAIGRDRRAAAAEATGVRAYAAGDWSAARQSLELAATVAGAPTARGAAYLERLQIHDPAFGRRLVERDGDRRRTRIYICGCGRSGTWLTAALMSAFEDTYVAPDEAPVGRFLALERPEGVHVVKRYYAAWRTVELIPPEITLLYVVRHPFDVLISTHPRGPHYITPERWRSEAGALRRILELGRSMLVLRFEDCVGDPAAALRRVGEAFGLRPDARRDLRPDGVGFAPPALAAMKGLRPPDPRRALAWRGAVEEHAYLRQILPELGEDLAWFADAFGYGDPAGELAALDAGSGA